MPAPGFDDDRERKTFSEVHGHSAKQNRGIRRRKTLRRRNRRTANLIKVNWNAYLHEDLYDMIMVAKPEVMAKRADQWTRLAEKIEITTGKVDRTIQDLLGTWRGSAAVASAESNTRLTQWAGEASHTAAQIGSGMGKYMEAVTEAKMRMPDPHFAYADRWFRDGYTVTGSGGPSTAILVEQLLDDKLESFEKREAARNEAVQVMESYEQQSREVHDTLPQFQDSPSSTPQPVPPGPTPPGPTPPGPTPPGPTPPVTGGPDDPGDGTSSAGFVDPSMGPGGSGPGSPGYGPGLGGGPGSGGGADATRGGPGFGGGGGGFAGGPGGRGAIPGGGGASGVGPLAARGGGPGAAGLAGARGGAGGMGGMYPPFAGAGTQGAEDKEHKNKYDDGLDLFDDLPPAYPPVFGA